MNTVNSFQDLASLKLILFFASSILIVMVGIIGWFLNRRDSAVTLATQGLTTATVELRIIVKSLQVQYELRQPMIDATLEINRLSIDEIFEKIEAVESRLIKLETEYKFLECNKMIVNACKQ